MEKIYVSDCCLSSMTSTGKKVICKICKERCKSIAIYSKEWRKIIEANTTPFPNKLFLKDDE